MKGLSRNGGGYTLTAHANEIAFSHDSSLSGFSQVLGYGLAILGPLGVCILHEATGGWTRVLIALSAKSLLLIFCATVLAHESKVEDDVRMPGSR